MPLVYGARLASRATRARMAWCGNTSAVGNDNCLASCSMPLPAVPHLHPSPPRSPCGAPLGSCYDQMLRVAQRPGFSHHFAPSMPRDSASRTDGK
jgi:hypothetical protein